LLQTKRDDYGGEERSPPFKDRLLPLERCDLVGELFVSLRDLSVEPGERLDLAGDRIDDFRWDVLVTDFRAHRFMIAQVSEPNVEALFAALEMNLAGARVEDGVNQASSFTAGGLLSDSRTHAIARVSSMYKSVP
jgi:hypothetical protein